MSKGNPKVVVRFRQEVLDRIEAAIQSANYNRKDEPYDVSAWIRKAVDDKLAHLERSKRKPKGD